MKKVIALMLATTALYGCSSMGERYDDATFVSDASIQRFQPQQGQYNLALYRYSGVVADTCGMAVYINRQPAVILQEEQKVRLLVPTGAVSIETRFIGQDECSNRKTSGQTVVVPAGTVRGVSLSTLSNGNVSYDLFSRDKW